MDRWRQRHQRARLDEGAVLLTTREGVPSVTVEPPEEIFDTSCPGGHRGSVPGPLDRPTLERAAPAGRSPRRSSTNGARAKPVPRVDRDVGRVGGVRSDGRRVSLVDEDARAQTTCAEARDGGHLLRCVPPALLTATDRLPAARSRRTVSIDFMDVLGYDVDRTRRTDGGHSASRSGTASGRRSSTRSPMTVRTKSNNYVDPADWAPDNPRTGRGSPRRERDRSRHRWQQLVIARGGDTERHSGGQRGSRCRRRTLGFEVTPFALDRSERWRTPYLDMGNRRRLEVDDLARRGHR